MQQDLVTLVVAFVGGGAAAKIVDWLTNRGSTRLQTLEQYLKLQNQTITELMERVDTLEARIASLTKENGELHSELAKLKAAA